MKKLIAMILALVMCLSLCACGAAPATEPTTEATTEPTTEATTAPTEPPLTETQLMVIDAVKELMAKEEFAAWEELYTQFTTEEAKNKPKVTDVTHYEIADFEGNKMDCYLVNVPVSIGHWVNEEAEQGAVEDAIYLFVDAETKTVYDSITTDALNISSNTKTELGRATYLMWIYAAMQTGLYDGNFLNDTEVVTHLTLAEIGGINRALFE